MEEMETEEFTSELIYRPKDVVWVRLSAGAMWWPSQVQDMTTIDPEITEGLKKKPLAVVKFLNEDMYEFVRSFDHIYHYNCKRKDEFLKNGFKKYYKLNNEKNMAMFPLDVQEAERLTGGDPEIINDPKYLPQEALEQSKVESRGRNSLPADFKGKKSNVPRMSAPAPSGDAAENSGAGRLKNGRPAIVKQGPTWYPYPKFITAKFGSYRKPPSDDPSAEPVEFYRCSSCCFETTSFELLMLHNIYNQHSTVSQPNRYRWRNPGSVRKPGSGAKKSSVRAKKDGTPKSAEKKSAKKKKKAVPLVPVDEFTPPKKTKMSSPATPNSHEVSQACAKIIEEWTDDEEEKPSDETAEDLFDGSSAGDSILETTTEAGELKRDEKKQPSLDAPQKPNKPAEPPKSSSCFDFDEEEPAEPGLQSSGKFGQIRLPRVITPEKSKPPDPLGDGNDIDSLLKEMSVPEIPSLPPSKQDSLFSRGERTYGSSPFKDAKKPSVTLPVKSDSNNDVNADTETIKNEEKHFLAEGPLQSKKRKSSGLTEGAEDGSAVNKKLKVGASPKKPSNEVVDPKGIDGESSKTAAKTLADEIAKQSLIDTLTHSPKADDQVTGESKTAEVMRDEPNESLLDGSAVDKISTCSAPHQSAERTDKTVKYDGEPPKRTPRKTPEKAKPVISEIAEERSRVSEEKELPTPDLESAPLGRSGRRSFRLGALGESNVHGSSSEQTKKKAREAHDQSPDSSKIGTDSSTPKTNLTEEYLEVPTPTRCDKGKGILATTVASSQDVSQEECKQAPTNRRSMRNKSVREDVPGVSSRLPNEEVPEKGVVGEKPSQEVHDQSKSEPLLCRKSDRNRESSVPESPKLPDNEIHKADDIIQLEAQKTDVMSGAAPSRKSCRNEKMAISKLAKLSPDSEASKADEDAAQGLDESRKPEVFDPTPTDPVTSPKLSRRSMRGKSGPSQNLEQVKLAQNEVAKAEDDVVQETLVAGTKPVSDKEEMQKTDVIIDGSPGTELVKSPPILESTLLSDKGTSKADVIHKDTHDSAEPAKTEAADVVDATKLTKLSRRSMRGKSPLQAFLEQVKSPSADVDKVEDQRFVSHEQLGAELEPLSGKEESRKTDFMTVDAGESIKSLPKSCRKSKRTKTAQSQEMDELKKTSEDVSHSNNALEAAVDTPDLIQSTPKPSRRSVRKKSQEPAESETVPVDVTSKREASPEEPETPASSRSNKKLKSSKETLDTQSVAIDATRQIAESPEPPSRIQTPPASDITQEPFIKKTPRTSRKMKKILSEEESKVQPENIKPEAVLGKVASERLKSSSTSKGSPKIDVPHESSRRSQRYRSQELPVSIPLPEDCLPKTDVRSVLPHENSESAKSPAHKAASSPISQASPKFESPQSSRRSKRMSSQEVPVSIPLSKGNLSNDANTSKIPLKIPKSQESPTSDESSQDSSKIDDSAKASKKSKKAQEVPVSIPLFEENLTKDGAAGSGKSPRSSRTSKKRASQETVEMKSPTLDGTPKVDNTIPEPQEDPKAKKSPSTAKTSASIVFRDSKANEKIRSSKISSRRTHSQEVPEPVTRKPQDEPKPVEPPEDDSTASTLEAEACTDLKSKPPLAEKPTSAEGNVPAENAEPLKPPSIEADEPPMSGKESTSIPPQEALISKSLCEIGTPKTDCATSIPGDMLKSTKQLPCDEAFTSISCQSHKTLEATGALTPDTPALTGVASGQEPCDNLTKQVDKQTEDSSKPTSKKSTSVSKKSAESISLPESVADKPDDGHKKFSKAAESRSASREAKSNEKDWKEDSKSRRQERSPRASTSTSQDILKGSSREDNSRSESYTSKRENASKEKQRNDRGEENRARMPKLVSQGDFHSKGSVEGAGGSASSIKKVESEVTEKLESPELCEDKVVKEATSPSKGAVSTEKPVPKDSPRKKKSKWEEPPKAKETMDTVETGKAVEPTPGAVKNAEENPPCLAKPLEITVFDAKNEIVVDTDLPVSSLKKQMVHSPSKTFRQDEAASLLEELLGSSPKSSPTSSPKKAKAMSPVKITSDTPTQSTADIKFSLSPSKVLDFGTPLQANKVVSSSENPPTAPSQSGLKAPAPAILSHLTASAPVKASRWDSPFPGKSSTTASPGKTPRSPGKKVNFEIISGLGRSCFKTDAPKLPLRLEPDSSNNQSDDELSALQAEIMSYSAMDKAKSTTVTEVKKGVPVSAKNIDGSPNSAQLQTSTESLSKMAQEEKEPSLSPTKSVDMKKSHVSPSAIRPPPQPAAPVKLPGLSEADLLASLDDAISFPLDEPVTADSIISVASDTIPSSKPSNAPILITVPSDSVQDADSAVKIVGTERQPIGNGLAQGFGSGADLLVGDLDINSIPFIMPDEEEGGMLSYSESTPSTAAPIAAEPVSSIPLPNEKPHEQPVTSTPRTSSVANSEQSQTSSVSSATPVHSISLPPAPELKEDLKEEIIETEIVMDHSETEHQNSETSALSLEEKFEQALVKQPWLRPDLLEVLTKGATEKQVFEARKVTQLVISLYDEDHPDYSYYMSLPPCQVGTSNFTKSWAAVTPSKATMVAVPSSTNPTKTVSSLVKPTSANSVRQISTTSHATACQLLSVDKSKSIVTVTRPEKGGEVIFADSSTKPVIVGTQSLTVPANVVRQVSASPVGTRVKQQLLQLFNKAQSGELDPETARKLKAITSNPDFMAKINKQHKVTVSSRPSADVQVQPSVLVARAPPSAKIVTSLPGTPVVVSQSKPIMVAAVSTPGTQPKANVLSTPTRSEPLKFTMESKFRNIQIASNSPKYVVACDPVTGVPAIKSQIVIGRNANTVGAGPSRSSTVPSTMQTIVVSAGHSVSSKPQTVNVANPSSTTVRVASAVPRPRIVQRVKTVTQSGSAVPTARLSQPQTVEVRKPQSKTAQLVRPTSKPETFTYVTITNNMVVPTTSEQVYVVNKTKSPVPPGSNILAEALADIDILPSDSEPFAEDSSADHFNPASVVITGSLGADQLSTMSFDSTETDNVNR